MKITRIIAAAALSAGLAVGPAAAAFADTAVSYEAPGVSATVSVVSPGAGQTFVFVITANVANVTLTISSPSVSASDISIAGTKSLTKATADGSATFDVTLNAAGTFTLVATDPATGAVLATQAVTVAASSGGGSASGSGSGLAATGSNEAPLIAGAAALVLLGAGGVVLTRRRHARQG